MTTEQRDIMKLYFSDTTNTELAEMLNVSNVTVSNWARKLGLRKSAEHRKELCRRRVLMSLPRLRATHTKYAHVYERDKEIMSRLSAGEHLTDIARGYGIPYTTLCHHLKSRHYI